MLGHLGLCSHAVNLFLFFFFCNFTSNVGFYIGFFI